MSATRENAIREAIEMVARDKNDARSLAKTLGKLPTIAIDGALNELYEMRTRGTIRNESAWLVATAQRIAATL